tara:strand:+ start:44 stop:472 length:429 start_codon:yes stop_codon:yes gene_type:complete
MSEEENDQIEQLNSLIESKLEYLKFSITPEQDGLDLIDKDAELGNLTPRELSKVNHYFDSLHRLQQFKVHIQHKGEEMILYCYPSAILTLKSKIKTLLVTSGSKAGFKALLQHTTIQRGEQNQTLTETTETKRSQFFGSKRK